MIHPRKPLTESDLYSGMYPDHMVALELKRRADNGDEFEEVRLMEFLDGMAQSQYELYCLAAYPREHWKNIEN